MPVKAPVQTSVSGWGGFYVGASVGSRWSDVDWTTNGFATFAPIGDNVHRFGPESARFGGYAGFNLQFGGWVTGLEAEGGFVDNGREAIPGVVGVFRGMGFGGAGLNPDETAVATRWDAALRGRMGYLVAPNTLLYGTGGLAVQETELSLRCVSLLCATLLSESKNKTQFGWTLGGGLETMFAGNWLARVDYRYSEFGRFDHTFFAGTVDAVNVSAKAQTHTVSAGIAYKFGQTSVDRGPVYVPPVRPASWSGLYAGGSVGARRTAADWETVRVFGVGAGIPAADNISEIDNTAFRLAGFAGANIQHQAAVFGIEADLGAAFEAKKKIWGIPGTEVGLGAVAPVLDRTSIATPWDGSLRLRAGLLIEPNVLVFATGGLAFQKAEMGLECRPGGRMCGNFPAQDRTETASKTMTGWTLGGGIEAMVTEHWFVRGDYRYADFGVFRHAFFADNPNITVTGETRITTHTATLGLGRRF